MNEEQIDKHAAIKAALGVLSFFGFVTFCILCPVLCAIIVAAMIAVIIFLSLYDSFKD